MKLLCYFLATKSSRTLDAYLCWRSSEIISIFIPFSLMEQIYLLFLVLLIWNYQVFDFLKFVRMSSLLFQDKRGCQHNKTQKKIYDICLQVTKSQYSWVLPKCFNRICCFQSLVTTIDYKCQYYLNKSKSMDKTLWTKLEFLLSILLLFVHQDTLWYSVRSCWDLK